MINFVMETENLSFPEAVTKLAEEKGIKVPTISSQDQRQEEERERLRQINQMAARYYYRNLRLPQGAQGRECLQKRGITEQLARLLLRSVL